MFVINEEYEKRLSAKRVFWDKKIIEYYILKNYPTYKYIDSSKTCGDKADSFKRDWYVKLKCEHGHVFKVMFCKFRKNPKCIECEYNNKIKTLNAQKNKIIWSVNNIKECVEKEGYTFIEAYKKKYKGKLKLWVVKLQCGNSNHEPYEVLWRDFFFKGARCKKCRVEMKKANVDLKPKRKIWDEESIKKYIEKQGYECLRVFAEFRNLQKTWRATVKCPNPKHKAYDVTFFSFKQGARCRTCSNERLAEFHVVKKDEKRVFDIYINKLNDIASVNEVISLLEKRKQELTCS